MDQQTSQPTSLPLYPPVVSVLGHVDHGKTSLLDAIRSTSIVSSEHGGITQKIGASSIEVMHEGKKRKITFIDTPGHEAFHKMRGRGAQAADIGILVVAATEGIMPQTKESIELLKQAKIPFIVALTKADLPTKNVEKVKQQLVKEGVALEGLGGEIPVIEVSAKTKTNIKELLDLILLVHDMSAKASPKADNDLLAIVIEAKLDARRGPLVTAVIKKGSLRLREQVYAQDQSTKVRALISDSGKQVKEAQVGEAVEILGFSKVPAVGSVISHKAVETTSQPLNGQLSRELTYNPQAKNDELAIILCADNLGSLEAILAALPKEIKVISHKTGEVSEADILLAKSTGAIVLGFNTPIKPQVQKLAVTEKILAKNYQIIYEMLDELSDVLQGKKEAKLEEVFGTAKILAKFPFEKTFAAGISVVNGRVARGDKIRLMRQEEVIGETTLSSLRVGKEPVSKVEKGKEAGLIFAAPLDFRVGDMLICHS